MLGLIRAEALLFYAEVLRRKSILVTFSLFPYLLTLLILLIGSSAGSFNAFESKVGISPVPFFISSSFVLMVVLGVSDEILWRPIYNEEMGTSPYVVSSPSNPILRSLAIPIPRLSLTLVLGSTSILPVLLYYFGSGFLLESISIMGLAALSGLALSSLAIAISGLATLWGESWRIIQVIRPLLFIFLGVFYPKHVMPTFARLISSLIPSSHTIEAIQTVLLGGSNILVSIGIGVALFMFYLPIGQKSLSIWERKKLRSGGIRT